MKITGHKRVLSITIFFLLFTFLLANSATGQDTISVEELTAGQDFAQAGAWFGQAVAISDTLMVVGAPYEDLYLDSKIDPIDRAGAAYVFTYDGTKWDLEKRLTSPDIEPTALFGQAVATDGHLVVVGAPGANSAYVFTDDGSGWELAKRLISPDTHPNDSFGRSVATCDNLVVVGTFAKSAAYVFTYDGSKWDEGKRLISPDTEPTPLFGFSVATDGLKIVVGAPFSRSAYVFTNDGSGWNEKFPLTQDAIWFGSTVAVSGDTVVVGAPSNLPSGPDGAPSGRGSTYVFAYDQDNSAWEQEDKLDSTELGLAEALGFGTSVAISGDRLAVSAPMYYVDVSTEDVGAVYLFKREVNGDKVTWTESEEQPIVQPVAMVGDRFGWSVSLTGNLLAVGAPFHNLNDGTQANNAGAAYVYDLPPAEEPRLVEILPESKAEGYELRTAEVGALPYVDRHYKIKTMSHRLEGSVLVATANDDKWEDASDHLRLKINRTAELFVCYDRRGACRRPGWLREEGWVRTNEYIKTSDWPASPLEVFKKSIEVDGKPVTETLPGNHYGGDTRARSNYFVLVKEPEEDIVTIGEIFSHRQYSLAGTIKDARPYTDRPYRIKAISDNLSGGVLVCTPNNDKRSRKGKQLELTINEDANVFVIYDKRGARRPPDWLRDGWERTRACIKTSYWPSSPMKVFKRFVKVGETPEIITLGGNLSGKCKRTRCCWARCCRVRCNYFVIVKKPEERIVDIVEVSTRKPYSLTIAEMCARPYIDRKYKIKKMSPELEGGVLVRTANDDKWEADLEHLKLAFGVPADVYVCYDKRGADNLPDWLDTWGSTDFFVETTDRPASPLVVLKTHVEPDGELTLGGNHFGGDTGARSNYFVIVKQ
jgi:hypothetical protein